MFFAVTLASLALQMQGDLEQEGNQPPSFSESKALHRRSEDLAISMKPLSRAVSGEAFKFWVIVKNKGSKRVVLDLADEDFIESYGFRPEQVPSSKPIGAVMLGSAHSLEAGMSFCPGPPTVFALNPGDGFERLAEISSLN